MEVMNNMYDFSFSIPTEIVFGEGCEMQAGPLMKQRADRVLLVYGSERIFTAEKGRRSLGEALTESLQEAGCTVFCYGGIRPNAEAAFIDSAIEVVRKEGIQGILAVGGGSVIDTAKAISAGFCYPGKITELYEDLSAYPEVFLPVGAVSTMAATASESNETSVISDEKTGRKIMRAFKETKPKFALLNPALTVGVSAFQTASGGFDIFAHAFERYFDLHRNSSIFDALTLSLMRQIVEILPETLKNPENLSLRGELMVSSNIAHNDMLGPGGDFACHEMSHVVTEHFGLAHGAALALLIPQWCDYVKYENPRRMAAFFRSVFKVSADHDLSAIETGIAALREFIGKIGLPLSLGEAAAKGFAVPSDTGDAQVSEMARGAAGDAGCIGFGFVSLKQEDIKEILRRIL